MLHKVDFLVIRTYVFFNKYFLDEIRNSVMNADFVAHYQFVQLVTSKSSKRLKMIHIKLKVKNLKQFQPKVDS